MRTLRQPSLKSKAMVRSIVETLQEGEWICGNADLHRGKVSSFVETTITTTARR